MTTTNPAPKQSKGRLAVACGIAAFMIVVGTMLPRVLTLPAVENSAAGPTPVAESSAAAFGLSQETQTWIERIVILASVLTLAGAGIGYLLKRRQQTPAANATRSMNVAAAVQLPHGCCAVLIEVGDRRFLAGIDFGGIRSVVTLPSAPEETAPALLEISA